MAMTTREPVDQQDAESIPAWLHRHPGVRAGGLLAAPMLWLALAYLGALALLFVSAFWTTDPFTNALVRTFTFDNFSELVGQLAYARIIGRTLVVAAAVTMICTALAVPTAFFMARVLSPRLRPVAVALVLTPLWASYLVKVYAWRAMVQDQNSVLEWLLGWAGVRAPGFGLVAVTITLAYLWLPYMVLPLYASFERLPDSLLDASSDLGAGAWTTFRRVVLPQAFPAWVAGSIFTFSLSMGDYITVQIVGGKAQMLGNLVYSNFVLDLPFAAAAATVPVAVMVIYLWLARRSGALDNL